MLRKCLNMVLCLLLTFGFVLPISAQEDGVSPIHEIYSLSQEDINESNLSYYGDYFSFVGSDATSIVQFTLRNTRGSDGDDYQAENIAHLYDNNSGWVSLSGNGEYSNADKVVHTIPSSSDYTFSGNFMEGITIESATNNLTLTIPSIPIRVAKQKGLAQFLMGSIQATLILGDRVVEGRLIYESLFLPGINPFTRQETDSIKGFQAFYASLNGLGDLYLHVQKDPLLIPLLGEKFGFVLTDNQFQSIGSFNMYINDSKPVREGYSLPIDFDGSFDALATEFKFDVHLENFDQVESVNSDGYYISVVTGSLKYNDRVFNLSGFGELMF